ncbi:MAG: hypothetical protein RIA69_19560 [Cyclobacteriaceae bacterium]
MKKLLIASVLKPVDDIRHFHKIAVSIRKTNKYEIHIIANDSKNKSSWKDIIFHPYKIRKSFTRRIYAQFHLSNLINTLKPSIVIITTIELLPLTVFLKLFYRFKLILDLQENYLANIKSQKEYTPSAKLVLKPIYKFISFTFFRGVDEFWLAEKSYTKLISKYRVNNIVLENKSLPLVRESLKKYFHQSQINFLFSGTISEYGGIRKAIKTWYKFKEVYPQSHLTIIGVCWDEWLTSWLNEVSHKETKIALFLDSSPIPHEEIELQIKLADIGLVTYNTADDSVNRMPTKCFEYASAQLPYLIEANTNWAKRGTEIGGAIPINFDQIDVVEIMQALTHQENLFANTTESPNWDTESPKLLSSKIL